MVNSYYSNHCGSRASRRLHHPLGVEYGVRMIKGIKFVSIPVADQKRALAFYTEKLGFAVATNQPMGPGGQRWIELRIGGSETRISLFTPPGHESRVGSFAPISLWADDVLGTYETLRARGFV